MELLERFAAGDLDAFETLFDSARARFMPGLFASSANEERRRI